MPTELKPVPEGGGRRAALIVVGVIAVLALIVGIAWVAFGHKEVEAPQRTPSYEPAQETTVATMPVLPGVGTSGSVTASASGGSTAPSATPMPRAARVAFRLGETLYVANEDGSAQTPVARVAEGAYALSPDGMTLAVVNASKLTLYDTSTGSDAEVGAAADEMPVWFPDSSAVLYVRKSPEGHGGMNDVWRVKRDASGAKKLHSGSCPAVSADGRTVALVGVAGVATGSRGYGAVFVSRDDGDFRTIKVASGMPVCVAVGKHKLYFGVTASGGKARIDSTSHDGSGRQVFRGAPDADTSATWGSLSLSPDGRALAAAAVGDDEYSRVTIFSSTSGSDVKLSSRRDTYLHGWAASGDRLFVIEGNTYQGEPTTLVSLTTSGSDRRSMIVGAR